DRGLAEARLTEQQRQELALHAARELGDLLLAAEEERARLLGEGSEPQPRIAFIDLTGRIGRRQFRNRVHRERARMKSSRRCAKSAGTCPPGSWLKCSALNLSGTRASAAVVASMLTGRMNTASSGISRAGGRKRAGAVLAGVPEGLRRACQRAWSSSTKRSAPTAILVRTLTSFR